MGSPGDPIFFFCSTTSDGEPGSPGCPLLVISGNVHNTAARTCRPKGPGEDQSLGPPGVAAPPAGPPSGRLGASPSVEQAPPSLPGLQQGLQQRGPLVLTSKASRRTCSQTCSAPAQHARVAASRSLQTHPQFPGVPSGIALPAGDEHHPHTRPG